MVKGFVPVLLAIAMVNCGDRGDHARQRGERPPRLYAGKSARAATDTGWRTDDPDSAIRLNRLTFAGKLSDYLTERTSAPARTRAVGPDFAVLRIDSVLCDQRFIGAYVAETAEQLKILREYYKEIECIGRRGNVYRLSL